MGIFKFACVLNELYIMEWLLVFSTRVRGRHATAMPMSDCPCGASFVLLLMTSSIFTAFVRSLVGLGL